jgi:hypothetical protein
VLKHLKTVFKHKLKNGDKSPSEIIDLLQRKLSNNTISKEDIEQLFRKYGAAILQYFDSDQCYQDFVFVNKSKTSRAYYMLHLKEIAIEARNGRLSDYPFFLRGGILKEIEKVVEVFHAERRRGQPHPDQLPPCEFNKEANCPTTCPELDSYFSHSEVDSGLLCPGWACCSQPSP